MKFVLVNGRSPKPQSFCALCCDSIGESYLREIATRLSYCDHTCYVDHCKVVCADHQDSGVDMGTRNLLVDMR
jgi:hypothetical protein